MNQSAIIPLIYAYVTEITAKFHGGHAKEHAYRPALNNLLDALDDVHAVNDPERSEYGNPDFIIKKASNSDVILGHAEAKDVNVSLDKIEKTDQMQRYSGYANLFLTNYLEFRFYRNGSKYAELTLGEVKNGLLHIHDDPNTIAMLADELQAFITQAPEKIRSGRRLAQIMGGKARRIRDNVKIYLSDENDTNVELEKMFQMMQKMLVHDMTPEKFADMYAQTLVYGLFVARYSDETPDNFNRTEARDLMPRSNPFLHHFFDHIAGPSFDTRLGYIVDELCEIFSVSDVQAIVHKHLRVADTTSDTKDPIIHFYEDFLNEYDLAERKKMGAYYTPIPVVKFIVRQVDRILKEDFGIAKGLASSETFSKQIELGQEVSVVKAGNVRATKTSVINKDFYRVQVLDPAVGTATFLNETIKFIHEEFKGQEGRWPAYVADNLVKRLHGFELMMAPYTIAHLKLAMTLKETGVEKLDDRLGIYLTNTLEEGIPQQPDLFSFGLAEAVSEESRHAAEIKSDHPIMVVMGNPPYSGHSSNNTKFANALVNKYKIEPGGKQKLQERNPKWLNDDYVKFIAFAEDMIEKNGSGVIAMITNNGYLDNPTFRGMRWHLSKTFDKLYVLDLHGNSKKREVAPDGSKDENVFDIMQGVGIILAVKTATPATAEATVYRADLWKSRNEKFAALTENTISWKNIQPTLPFYSFKEEDYGLRQTYNAFSSVRDLFNATSIGLYTGSDEISTALNKDALIETLRQDGNEQLVHAIEAYNYRCFYPKELIYSRQYVARGREAFYGKLHNDHFLSLIIGRQINANWSLAFVTEGKTDLNLMRGGAYHLPLFIDHEDGTRTANFNSAERSALLKNLQPYRYVDSKDDVSGSVDDIVITAEDILDYIYAVLYSPNYRETYKEFLQIDFPRIPQPENIKQFTRLVELGSRLRRLHLMKATDIDNYGTSYPETGDNIVEKIRYENERVYINDTQYFGNVPSIAWNFYIGGYQPAQKWLKDRKGRQLTNEDLDHFQRMIKILTETETIMHEIDAKA